MNTVLGLDCGLTVTKAVIYDVDGTALGTGSGPSPRATPRPHWVERDVDQLWRACASAIAAALHQAGIPGSAVAAVGVTGHGDGLYCLGEDGTPTRAGISSLDSRAHEIARRWRRDRTAERALALTGQQPDPSSPVTLLRWLAEEEPKTLASTRWILWCKDAIRFALTGSAATDPTEASESFTDVTAQDYDPAVLQVFDLEAHAHLLPPIRGCTQVAGTVTPAAAAETGLAAGTPVVTGLHDVNASAIGSGCVAPGQLSVIAGTYSINQVIAAQPCTDPRWFARTFAVPGLWMHMGISPASATNLEWFLAQLCPDVVAAASTAGTSPYDELARAYQEVVGDPSDIVFLPYLYGTPGGVQADAAFTGIRGWHRRAHLLRAVLEGVVFNHRRHVDALRERFAVTSTRLTGGAARAPHWARLFANALGLPIEVEAREDAVETGALGAAMCAWVGIGAHPDLAAAAASVVGETRVLEPDMAEQRRLDAAYERFVRVSEALSDGGPP